MEGICIPVHKYGFKGIFRDSGLVSVSDGRWLDVLVDRIDPASRGMDAFQAVNTGCLALHRFGLHPCVRNGVMILLLGIP